MYNSTCLETIHPYLVIDTNTSVLILSEHGQFTQNSKIIDIIGQLFVHEWKMNFSYDAFFNTCAPIKCTYTYTKRANFIYIISILLGFYGGLTVALRFVVLNAIKFRHMRNNRSPQAVQGLFFLCLYKKILFTLQNNQLLIDYTYYLEK